jgi:hypothetical protein
LPPEAGRLVMHALLARARRERGCTTPGDDGLEARVYAVKRYLFRLGHAARSGRYASSVEQLVVGLAPVMGWGAVPVDVGERRRFVAAHRRSVQRWLDDLQASRIAAHEPERDSRGLWWRTQIVLLAAPQPEASELEAARRRARLGSSRAGATSRSSPAPLAGRDPLRSQRSQPARSRAARPRARPGDSRGSSHPAGRRRDRRCSGSSRFGASRWSDAYGAGVAGGCAALAEI